MALKRVGSLWKSDRGGKTVLSGKADREGASLPPNAKLLIFKNDKDGNAKRPDYTLHVAVDDELPETPSGGSYEPPPDGDDLPF